MPSYLSRHFLPIFLLLSGCTSDHLPLPLTPTFQNIVLPPATKGLPDTVAIKDKTTALPSLNTAINKTFTLDKAIQTALKSDPRISSAWEIIKQAEADLVTAGLIPNPDFSAGGSLIALDKKFTVTRQGGPPQIDVGVAMPIDWFLFGKRAAAITSGEYAVDVASADFANVLRLRIAATIFAFYDVLEAQALLELAEENLKNLEAMEKIIVNRVALGGIGTIEVDRIKLSIFASRRELHTQELNLSAAFNKLKTLLGISDNTVINVEGNLDVINPKKPINIEEAFKLAEQNRPDLASLRHQLDKTNADIEFEERKAFPQVIPKIGYTRQFQQQAIGFPDANSWGAGVDVVVPIFDRNQGNIAKAKSVYLQTRHNLEAQFVDIRAEIDQAVKAFSSAHRFVVQDDPGQLEAAKNVRDKINQAYELGGKTLIEVLDAQRAYLETYKVHISGRSGYWHALYQLDAAIGKDLSH